MTLRLPAARPLTYFITDGSFKQETFSKQLDGFLRTVGSAVEAGITMVQIREKALTGRWLFELASAAAGVTRGTGTKLLVNDRVDIAVAAGADGVHLTGRSMPAEVVRNSFGDDLLIGVSTHSVAEVLNAAVSGADFAVFGPIFVTPGKGEPVGVGQLRTACERTGRFPVLALGGIEDGNIEMVIDAGAAGYAAIRWFYRKLAG